MDERTTLNLLAVATLGTALAVIAAIALPAYQQSLEQQRLQIQDSLARQVAIIDAVADFDRIHSRDANPEGAWGATFDQLRDAIRRSPGRIEGGHILFTNAPIDLHGEIRVFFSGGDPDVEPMDISADHPLFEAAARGLAGSSGYLHASVGGLGESMVIYQPIRGLSGAMLAVQPVSEIRGRFLPVLFLGLAIALVVGFLGSRMVIALGRPAVVAAKIQSERLRSAQRIAHLGYWAWDAQTNVLECSGEMVQIWGLDPGGPEPTQRALMEAIHPDDRPRVRDHLRAQRDPQGAPPKEIQYRVIRPDGEVRHVRAAVEATPEGPGDANFFGIVHDESEVIQAQQQIANVRDELAATLANIADGVITIDRHGTIRSFNRAAEDLFGYQTERVVGGRIEILMDPETASAHQGFIDRLISTKQPRIMGGPGRELVAQHADGRDLDVELRVSEMRVGDERVYIGTVRDISERKRAETEIHALNASLERRVEERTRDLKEMALHLDATLKEMESAQSQLAQSEKMAALGSLVAGVAHEVNTPIGISVTAISHVHETQKLLKSDLASGTLSKSRLDRHLLQIDEGSTLVLANLRRAADLIHSFKQVAVDQSNEEARPFNLGDYITEVLLSLSPRFKKTAVEVGTDLAPEVMMHSFPGAIAQVITNLVLNSILHGFDKGKEPGTVTVQTRTQPALNPEDPPLITLSVTDDGRGMTEEIRKTVFHPFVTTRAGDAGTGLGMHIVYNVVTDRLGGTIRCESEPGEGVTFVINIPAIAPGAVDRATAA